MSRPKLRLVMRDSSKSTNCFSAHTPFRWHSSPIVKVTRIFQTFLRGAIFVFWGYPLPKRIIFVLTLSWATTSPPSLRDTDLMVIDITRPERKTAEKIRRHKGSAFFLGLGAHQNHGGSLGSHSNLLQIHVDVKNASLEPPLSSLVDWNPWIFGQDCHVMSKGSSSKYGPPEILWLGHNAQLS